MGLKESGLRGSLRNVSVGIDAIPDSLKHQYTAEEFGDPWTDNIGEEDMAVSGLSKSNDLVEGDGMNDFGEADLESWFKQDTWGMAVTIEANDLDHWLGGAENDFDDVYRWRSNDGRPEVFFRTQVEGTQIDSVVRADTVIEGTGDVHLLVINRTGNSASDLEWYVDDMEDENEEAVVETDDGDFSGDDFGDLGMFAFYARDQQGTAENFSEMGAGIWEFNNEPYSEEERQDLLDRRNELS